MLTKSAIWAIEKLHRGRRKILAINHPPDLEPRYGHGKPPARSLLAILDHHSEAQRALLSAFQGYRDKLSAIPLDDPGDAATPHWRQGWIPPLDGISLYALTAHLKPRRIVEIGSGHSTRFLRRAVSDHALGSTIASIDPVPRADITAVTDHVMAAPLETVDLSVFDDLDSGDMVFFDGSHRCLQNSDVTVFFIDVLPRLKPGTLVGIHDIFWPNDYPPDWKTRAYNEQYVLAAYMAARGLAFPVVLANAYAGQTMPEAAEACLDPALARTLKAHRGIKGGAFWFRVPDAAFAA